MGLLLLALVLSASLPTKAATLLSTLGQSQDTGYNFSGGILASDFNTGSWNSTITGLTIAIAKLNNSDVVTASLYTDAGGQPGTSLGSFSSINIPGYLSFATVANYTATTAGISLAANTNYWLGFTINTDVGAPINNNNGTDSGSLFTTISATQVKQGNNAGTSYSNVNAGNLIYSLSGTATAAPEPSRTLLLLSGLGMVIFRRRRGKG